MELAEILQYIGLEAKEVAIYLALLELGESSVLAIAKKAGVKRPTAYLVINSLEQKGFVTKVFKGQKICYVPNNPRKLITETELRLKELELAMPQMESLFQRKPGKPRVMIYNTKDESDRASDDIFVMKGEVMYMGTLSLSQEAFPKTFRKVDLAALSSDFRIRELIDDSYRSREYGKKVSTHYRQVRFIPQELLPFEVDMSIFGDRTLITSVTKEHFTVGIESPEINRAFRSIFEVMWRTANI